MSHVSIWDIISVKMRRENWCRIDTWLETPVTRNINTLWQSNAVLYYYARDCGLCLCGLTAVGAYIHSAASSPKGGENVIYTLIMPAPLNTPLARCNILDISTSLSLPLSSSFSAFHINPHTSWAPCWYLLSSSWIQSSASTDVLLWSVYIFMYVCSICTVLLLAFVSFSLCLLLVPQPPHQNASSIHLFPLLLYVKKFSGGLGNQPCDNSTVSPPMGN